MKINIISKENNTITEEYFVNEIHLNFHITPFSEKNETKVLN